MFEEIWVWFVVGKMRVLSDDFEAFELSEGWLSIGQLDIRRLETKQLVIGKLDIRQLNARQLDIG